MTIKVCHVTSMHRVFDTRIFYKECASLSKKYEVYLVASNVESQIKNGIHIVGVPMPPHGIRKMLTTKPVIKAAEEIDADVYHFHDPELIRAGLKLKKKGKKVIFDYHENFKEFLLTKDLLPKTFRTIASFLWGMVEKKALSKYHAVISVTPFIVDRLKEYNSRTYQITNYPFKENIADNREWGKSICFVGGIVPQWMHHNIIKSLDKTNAIYRLAGAYAPESYYEELKCIPSWEKVDYKGMIDYKEIFPFLQKSSAGMLIRTYKDPNSGYTKGSLGCNKLFEYMMAGIPLISSNMEEWAKIIEKYKCGIVVDPDDIESITRAVNYVVNNPEEAKRMGDNGKKAAMEYYHWGTQEVLLYGIYDYVLNL